MSEVLQYQDTTAQYHTDVMAKLERMNATLGSMLHYLDVMQTRIEGRLHIIQGYLGWAGTSGATWAGQVRPGAGQILRPRAPRGYIL